MYRLIALRWHSVEHAHKAQRSKTGRTKTRGVFMLSMANWISILLGPSKGSYEICLRTVFLWNERREHSSPGSCPLLAKSSLNKHNSGLCIGFPKVSPLWNERSPQARSQVHVSVLYLLLSAAPQGLQEHLLLLHLEWVESEGIMQGCTRCAYYTVLILEEK